MINQILKNITIILMIFCLKGCANIEQLNKAQLRGDKFQNNLVEYYKKLAYKNVKSFNWSNYQHFIEKAFVATKGISPLPENLYYWKIPQNKLKEFTLARKKLISLIHHHKLKNTHPELAAKAQYHFDCWVEEQDKSLESNINYQCREIFYKSFYQLSNLIRIPYPAIKQITTQKIIDKSKQKLQTIVENKKIITTKSKIFTAKKYIFTMKENDARLEQKQKENLLQIASYVNLNPTYHLNILSYNNSEISEDEKMIISKYRVQIIKDTLKKHGIKNNQISSYVFGSLTSEQVNNELETYGENSINIIIGQ